MVSFLVGPGLLESSERTARCGRGAMRSALVWIGGALAFEGRWLERTTIDAANWLDDIHERLLHVSCVKCKAWTKAMSWKRGRHRA